jgi:deoxyadenosine/deoxycytidine kinase
MGTMGSGKTTAARLIAQTLGYHLVEENFGENAFLPRFYKKMNRWAFHSQTFFLMEKINQLMEIGENVSLRGTPTLRRETKQSLLYGVTPTLNTVIPSGARNPVRDRISRITGIVQDTPIEQDVFSYAKAQHTLGNMDDAEWKLYRKIYESFAPHLPKPDLIVYLKTSLPAVEKRIAGRGRGYEKKIPRNYLRLLEQLNEEWIVDHAPCRILTIETDGLNIVTSKNAQQELLTQVKKTLDR